MRIFSMVGVCILIAALSTAAHSQRVPAEARISVSQATLDSFLKALNANRLSALYSGIAVPCTIGVGCNVTLTPQELFDANNNLVACAMQVGEIQIDVGTNPVPKTKTVIHWTIGPPAAHTPPTNAIYTFETQGLIIFKDSDNATLKKADSVTDTDLFMTHKFMARHSEVIYYPLVFQKIGTNPPALCGSADPKVVNN